MPAVTQGTASGFSQASSGQPAFGQMGFAPGKATFRQPVFGKTSFGTTTTMAPTSSGSSAFANAPTTLTNFSTTKPVSGFGAPESKSESVGGFTAFGSMTQAPFTSAIIFSFDEIYECFDFATLGS